MLKHGDSLVYNKKSRVSSNPHIVFESCYWEHSQRYPLLGSKPFKCVIYYKKIRRFQSPATLSLSLTLDPANLAQSDTRSRAKFDSASKILPNQTCDATSARSPTRHGLPSTGPCAAWHGSRAVLPRATGGLRWVALGPHGPGVRPERRPLSDAPRSPGRAPAPSHARRGPLPLVRSQMAWWRVL